jgi:enoyl-CoA hydratase
MGQEIALEQRGDCSLLIIDRPEVLNALSFGLLEELDQALDQVAVSASRTLIVTGRGERAFCAGADIKELLGRSLAECKAGSERGQAIFQKLADLPMPSVALINGYAFGGGLELALACSFRLAVPRAKLGLPEIKLGLIPGYGGTQRLTRLIGAARAAELILTGATIDAQRAYELGLVNRIIEGDPFEAALSFVREFSGYSLVVLRFARAAIQRATESSLSEGLKSENELSTLAYLTEDSAEGMTAFLEKRAPRFRDR